jgi:5-formyltetrahydrofolate cyclo-ligase
VELISRSDEWLGARTVGIFYPRGREVDITPLWSKATDRCAFPRVAEDGKSLVFFRVADLTSLSPGYKGILEPPPEDRLKIKEWGPEDLILVPGLAFDLTGARLGSGVGFYDRFLSNRGKEALPWGVCLDEQLSREILPREEHDVSMKAICTPSQIHRLPF